MQQPLHNLIKSNIRRMLQYKWTKKNAVITVTVTVLIFSPLLYMFFLGQTYGMPDEIRTAVDCIGKEINTLRAHNAVLETYDTTNSSDPIAKNNERVDDLFVELDRLWPAGSLRYLTEVSNITGFEQGCLSGTGGIPVRQAEEFRNAGDALGVAVGGTDMFVSGILPGLSTCTSGVVVERVSHDGIVETGILTNQHCGDVFSLRVDDASVDVEKVTGSWFCDCAFVRTGDLLVDPSAVWTDWGAMHVSGYKDFKIGEWVEFHGRNGYSLGRVLSVVDVWFSKAYIVDVVVSHGDSGGPFIGLEDRIFGGMNSAARDGSIDVGVAFGFAWSAVQQNLDVYEP